jgi:hypothetical protein
VANNYTTTTDTFADIPESAFGTSTDTAYATAMDGFITTASRLIDLEFGRWEGFFYPTTDDKTYYYDGDGEYVQDIDEFASITTVSVSERGGLASTDYTDWTLNTDYITRPSNATNKGKPINQLEIASSGGTKGAWYAGQRSVRVVGIPGYSTTPPDVIEHACRMQATRWFMRAKQGYQDTGVTAEIGPMTFSRKLELDPDIKALLHPLKLELDR